MTQHDFTEADFCSGRWPAPSDRELRDLLAEFTGEPARKIPLPKRTPGKYANDKIWQVKA